MVLLQNDKITVLPFFIKISFKNSWKIPKLAQFIPEIYNNFYYKILGYFWGVTVSGYPKSTGIPRVDRLSTGPPGFGVSHWNMQT